MNNNFFTHLDKEGKARMVNISNKKDTKRTATAEASIIVNQEVMELLLTGKIAKGDVLVVAKIAGIQGAKKTSELIPLAHPLPILHIDINFEINREKNIIKTISRVETIGKTGVEMEALTAASIASLTIYDMCKAFDKAIVIKDVRLLEKTGGKSGDFKLKTDI